MTDYKALSDKLRKASSNFSESEPVCNLLAEAANAVNDLFNAASSMHEWIFLHTADEQKAYDECGLSDEINCALGYGGKLEL